jgi:hypothetical protein
MKMVRHNHVSMNPVLIVFSLIVEPIIKQIKVFLRCKYLLPFTNSKSYEVYLLRLKFCLVSYSHYGL